MSERLSNVYVRNALKILATERRKARRIDQAYRILCNNRIEGGIVDWLANPFIRTALSILEGLQGNYKVREAIKLLKEAGKDAASEKARKGK